MFYETAQTVGPGWHRSYKPSHYEDMNWTPSSKNFRSPGSSPETYRRIIRNEEDFPRRNKDQDEDFFSGRRSPTFPRRVFKEVWEETPLSNHRFSERPKMFKRVFRPDRWEDDFDRDIPHLRRVDRDFDRSFDDVIPSRKFDEDFEKRFTSRDFKKNMEEGYEKPDAKVHHIPIMVERRMDDIKSHFGKNERHSPPEEKNNEAEDSEEWQGPQVRRLKKAFEQPDDLFSSRFSNARVPRADTNSKPRPYVSPSSETWDPHAIHTLPTRKAHKSSQSFDDSKHPIPPKYVFRSYSETHEDSPKPQQPHSAAFRSHSDGHCPQQTYVTKINVNLPSQKEKDELDSPRCKTDSGTISPDDYVMEDQTSDDSTVKSKGRNKYSNPSMQQIAAVLQNVEDLIIRVDNYSGTGRDKHYRFLDEMLTRCMLRLDDVDTEGREDIRNARKAALREVQNCVDKLEAKADESERLALKNKAIPPEKAVEAKDESPNCKKAIPLPHKPVDKEVPSNTAIPLPAGPSEKESAKQSSSAIPLGDKVEENDRCKKAIPLGYIPRSEDSFGAKEEEKNDHQNGEQTKL